MVNDYVWYAAYDEDMLNGSMLKKIEKCSDKTLPLEFQSLKIQGYEAKFKKPNMVFIEKKQVFSIKKHLTFFLLEF